jgi:hypothetical protein
MGKLHTLRRAVERHPDKFINDYRLAGMGVIAQGAIFRDGQWEPIVCDRETSRLFPYRKLVRSVLLGLGYDVR